MVALGGGEGETGDACARGRVGGLPPSATRSLAFYKTQARTPTSETRQTEMPYGKRNPPSQETHLCFAICGDASPVEPLREPLRPAHLGSFTMAGSDNPFVNADAWRKHPLLNGTWRHIAPGFFIGLTAFGAFYAYDKATQKKAAKH